MKWARKVAAFSARSSGQSREACQGTGLTCEKCLVSTVTVSGSSGSRRWARGVRTEEEVPLWSLSGQCHVCRGQRAASSRRHNSNDPPPPTHMHSGPGTAVCPAGGRQSGQEAGLAHAALGEPDPAPQHTFTLRPCLSVLLSVPPTQSTPSCPGAFAQATQGPPLVQASPVGSY